MTEHDDIREAAREGAEIALREYGLTQEEITRLRSLLQSFSKADITQVRGLLDAFNMTKRTIQRTVVETLTKVAMGALIAWLALRYGGGQS